MKTLCLPFAGLKLPHATLTAALLLLCARLSASSAPDTLKLPGTEMDVYNGLMYAPADMRELKKTADSLGLQFKQCPAPHSFRTWPQAAAVGVRFEVKQEDAVAGPLMAALQGGASLQSLEKKYGKWMTGKPEPALVAYHPAAPQERAFYAGSSAGGFTNLYTDSTKFNIWRRHRKGGWVYREGSRWNKEGHFRIIYAWQLQEPFSAGILPAAYGEMISYVDCMVDTSVTLMLAPKRPYSGEVYEQSLREYINRKTKRNVFLRNEMDDDELMAYIRKHYATDSQLRKITDLAVENDLPLGYNRALLSSIAAELIPKEKLLMIKRSSAVTGTCSMDDRPRQHARSIAVLASQTHQWPVFIRAHLNIMNDYFDRVTDGSYAWAGRKTYLKELEALNINTVNLLLGSVLRTANAASGHYAGDMGRCGRALVETKDPGAFEAKLERMLKDEELDDFNRGLLFFLYAAYCYNQPTKERTMEKITRMQQKVNSYPAFIQPGIRALKLP